MPNLKESRLIRHLEGWSTRLPEIGATSNPKRVCLQVDAAERKFSVQE